MKVKRNKNRLSVGRPYRSPLQGHRMDFPLRTLVSSRVVILCGHRLSPSEPDPSTTLTSSHVFVQRLSLHCPNGKRYIETVVNNDLQETVHSPLTRLRLFICDYGQKFIFPCTFLGTVDPCTFFKGRSFTW